MDVSEVVTARFLAGFEQRAWASLPGGWEEPRPERGKLRRSAAVLLEIAELPNVGEMTRALGDIAARVAQRESRRERELDERGAAGGAEAKAGESGLWRQVRALLERLEEVQAGKPKSLFTLEICRGETWIRPIGKALQAAGAPPPPASPEALAALARILLRATARRWSEEDRRQEKEKGATG